MKSAPTYSETEYQWRLEPHVCRRCFGRVLSKRDAGGMVFQCASCGLAGQGKHGSVCCCGIRLRRSTASGTTASLVDAGMRCHANESPTPAFPSLFVASYRGA